MGSQENATNRGDTRLSSNYQMLPIIPTVNSYDEIEARKRERLHERVCLVEKRHPGLSFLQILQSYDSYRMQLANRIVQVGSEVQPMRGWLSLVAREPPARVPHRYDPNYAHLLPESNKKAKQEEITILSDSDEANKEQQIPRTATSNLESAVQNPQKDPGHSILVLPKDTVKVVQKQRQTPIKKQEQKQRVFRKKIEKTVPVQQKPKTRLHTHLTDQNQNRTRLGLNHQTSIPDLRTPNIARIVTNLKRRQEWDNSLNHATYLYLRQLAPRAKPYRIIKFIKSTNKSKQQLEQMLQTELDMIRMQLTEQDIIISSQTSAESVRLTRQNARKTQ